MARGGGVGDVDARTRAPPQPLFGTHARVPFLSGPEGSPEQSGWASGAVGGCSGLLRARALWPRCAHRATPRQPELACCCSKVPILSRSSCSGAGWSPVGSWRGQPCEAHLVRVRVRAGVRASEQLERARVRGAPGCVQRRLRICNFSRGWCPALCLSLDPERHGSSSRAWSATEGQPREPQDAGVASCGPPKTAHSQHAGAPATLKTALRLPHGAVAAERARYMAGAGEAAVGLGLLEHPIVMALLPLHVLLRRRLGAVDSLRTWPGFWVGVRVGVGARARVRLTLGLGSARVRLAQSQLPHRAKPRHCASRAGASAPWRS